MLVAERQYSDTLEHNQSLSTDAHTDYFVAENYEIRKFAERECPWIC